MSKDKVKAEQANKTQRNTVIEILIATRGESEGNTADAILSALSAPKLPEACPGIGKCNDQGCPNHYAASSEPVAPRVQDKLRSVVADIRAHCDLPNPETADEVSACYALLWAERIEAALEELD